MQKTIVDLPVFCRDMPGVDPPRRINTENFYLLYLNIVGYICITLGPFYLSFQYTYIIFLCIICRSPRVFLLLGSREFVVFLLLFK